MKHCKEKDNARAKAGRDFLGMCRKVRQDRRQTSSKDGKTVFVLCEDSEIGV